jgi:hypothetical protein
MDTIKISKVKLLGKLEENRATHIKIYEEAIEGWEMQLASHLMKIAEDIKINNRGHDGVFELPDRYPKPIQHTKDYDVIIDKIQHFSSSSASYSSSSAGGSLTKIKKLKI